MEILGEWLLCDDGTVRPVIHAAAAGIDGKPVTDRFLVDSGADRSVFSSVLLNKLKLPKRVPPPELALMGIGGISRFVLVTTVLQLTQSDGGTARVRGEFAALLDSEDADFSILGRDVLDHFDVILSKRRGEVLLLGLNHRYTISPGP
jgi:Aspartyl protease